MPAPTDASKSWSQLHEEGMGATQDAFLELVRQTKESRHYCDNIVWGNLQTPDYARAILTLVVDFHGFRRDIEEGVAARTARAQFIGEGDRTYHVLLGEGALRRNVGGRDVMRGQLRALLEGLDLRGLRLGVIPDRAQLDVYPGNSFSLFDGNRVEVEGYGEPSTLTDQKNVDSYTRAFALLEHSAVYGEDARSMIQRELDAL